ncbi:MAG: ATP-binding protein [Prevotellaceae bacterium]|jgi:AAA15 family ATPase/GTPase|nr:ATP-binding protein [Prevotellaceae bacterium]
MLLEFTVGNYLSFKDKKTLSLEATAIKDFPNNVMAAGEYKLLRSAVIYGANSSGKSNLLKALNTMRDIVINSAKLNSTDKINVTPFLLNTETEKQPSFFEIILLIDDVRYRYGFEASSEKVYHEWLYEKGTKGKEQLLFVREDNKIVLGKTFEEGKALKEKTRENALFLAICDQFNGEKSRKILRGIGMILNISGINHTQSREVTKLFLERKDLKPYIEKFITTLDLGFDQFTLSKDTREIITRHPKYNAAKERISQTTFNSLACESSGTNKVFDLVAYILAGLNYGHLIIIDELDAKLHPLLTKQIVKMFNDPSINTSNGQLIFASHDTNLLNYAGLRRDQIYFTEKNEYEETDLYSLAEFREPGGTKVRNDRNYEKDYIEGRYGAIPFIGNFSKITTNGAGN